MPRFRFDPLELPPETEALRREVRAFLKDEVARIAPEIRAQSWSASDPDFSHRLAARGWIAMTWPKKYGGHERTHLERYGRASTPRSAASWAKPASLA